MNDVIEGAVRDSDCGSSVTEELSFVGSEVKEEPIDTNEEDEEVVNDDTKLSGVTNTEVVDEKSVGDVAVTDPIEIPVKCPRGVKRKIVEHEEYVGHDPVESINLAVLNPIKRKKVRRGEKSQMWETAFGSKRGKIKVLRESEVEPNYGKLFNKRTGSFKSGITAGYSYFPKGHWLAYRCNCTRYAYLTEASIREHIRRSCVLTNVSVQCEQCGSGRYFRGTSWTKHVKLHSRWVDLGINAAKCLRRMSKKARTTSEMLATIVLSDSFRDALATHWNFDDGKKKVVEVSGEKMSVFDFEVWKTPNVGKRH